MCLELPFHVQRSRLHHSDAREICTGNQSSDAKCMSKGGHLYRLQINMKREACSRP
jgi:hypothetical protein